MSVKAWMLPMSISLMCPSIVNKMFCKKQSKDEIGEPIPIPISISMTNPRHLDKPRVLGPDIQCVSGAGNPGQEPLQRI